MSDGVSKATSRQLHNELEFIMSQKRFIRVKELLKILSISRSTLYDWINPKSSRYDESFPKPIKIGNTMTVWISTMIEDWMDERYREQNECDEEKIGKLQIA